jgi:hypothetical protein
MRSESREAREVDEEELERKSTSLSSDATYERVRVEACVGSHPKREHKNRATSLFVDLNKVPNARIELLLGQLPSSSCASFFASFFPLLPSSAPLRFCFVSLKLYIVSLHNFSKPGEH